MVAYIYHFEIFLSDIFKNYFSSMIFMNIGLTKILN